MGKAQAKTSQNELKTKSSIKVEKTQNGKLTTATEYQELKGE